jgi:hypothetical protein
MIGRTRLEDITLYNYLKYEVLGCYFIERLEDVSLTYSATHSLYLPDYSDYDPSPASVGRGWVPFDESGGSIDTAAEQTTRVSVTGASTYTVNYLLGGIQNPNTVPTAVSFYWNYVSVVEGWPGGNPPPIPIVAIDILGYQQAGWQLGSGHIKSRAVSAYIFAHNKAERDDITEVLYDALYNKAAKLIDYSTGDYLASDGTFNSSFAALPITGTGKLYFDNVQARVINIANDWSDLNKFRSSVSFTMTSYVD